MLSGYIPLLAIIALSGEASPTSVSAQVTGSAIFFFTLSVNLPASFGIPASQYDKRIA